MSFFIETPSENEVMLLSTHEDNEPFKQHLSKMGGTFFRSLKTTRGNIYPGWVFDGSQKANVEAFVTANEDTDSVNSLPDTDLMFDEIFRRLNEIEKTLEDLIELTANMPPHSSNSTPHPRTQERRR